MKTKELKKKNWVKPEVSVLDIKSYTKMWKGNEQTEINGKNKSIS